jgi:hypothetical protein
MRMCSFYLILGNEPYVFVGQMLADQDTKALTRADSATLFPT